MNEQLPHSHLIMLEHCGHLSTMEQPEQVTKALRDWIANEGIWKETTA